MKKTNIKYLILLTLTTHMFLGCAKQDTVETTKVVSEIITEDKNVNKASSPVEYGQYTDEIEKFLSATPLGSEIYLEEKESGEWYLKIEKTFTAKKDEEKTKMIEPIAGESILI